MNHYPHLNLVSFPDQLSTELPKLGDYVERRTDQYAHLGRVYQIHHTCPQDEQWLARQTDQSVRDHVDEPWASVLTDGGGSIVTPVAALEVVPAFPFTNDYEGCYFRPEPEAS